MNPITEIVAFYNVNKMRRTLVHVDCIYSKTFENYLYLCTSAFSSELFLIGRRSKLLPFSFKSSDPAKLQPLSVDITSLRELLLLFLLKNINMTSVIHVLMYIFCIEQYNPLGYHIYPLFGSFGTHSQRAYGITIGLSSVVVVIRYHQRM